MFKQHSVYRNVGIQNTQQKIGHVMILHLTFGLFSNKSAKFHWTKKTGGCYTTIVYPFLFSIESSSNIFPYNFLCYFIFTSMGVELNARDYGKHLNYHSCACLKGRM